MASSSSSSSSLTQAQIISSNISNNQNIENAYAEIAKIKTELNYAQKRVIDLQNKYTLARKKLEPLIHNTINNSV